MKNLLVLIFNRRAYPVLTTILLLAVGVILLLDQELSITDIAILTAVIVFALVLWGLLVSRQSEGVDSVNAVRRLLNNGNRPSVVQFFSRYCVGCLAVKPVVDQLEKEAGDRIQIIRLDIDEEPGKSLAEEHRIVFTPSFVYFDARGTRLRETTFILDRSRILYELEEAR